MSEFVQYFIQSNEAYLPNFTPWEKELGIYYSVEGNFKVMESKVYKESVAREIRGLDDKTQTNYFIEYISKFLRSTSPYSTHSHNMFNEFLFRRFVETYFELLDEEGILNNINTYTRQIYFESHVDKQLIYKLNSLTDFNDYVRFLMENKNAPHINLINIKPLNKIDTLEIALSTFISELRYPAAEMDCLSSTSLTEEEINRTKSRIYNYFEVSNTLNYYLGQLDFIKKL